MPALDEQETAFLLEVAYAGLNTGVRENSAKLFQLLISLCPDNPHPSIGMALLKYSGNERDEAIRILTEVLERFPAAVFTRAMLARFLKENQQAGWEELARQAIEMDEQGMSADIARSVLGVADEGSTLSSSIDNQPHAAPPKVVSGLLRGHRPV